MKIYYERNQISKTLIDEKRWTTSRFTWGEGYNEIEHSRTEYSIVDEIVLFVENVTLYKKLGGITGNKTVDVGSKTDRWGNINRLVGDTESNCFKEAGLNVLKYSVKEHLIILENIKNDGDRHEYKYRVLEKQVTKEGLIEALRIELRYFDVIEETW